MTIRMLQAWNGYPQQAVVSMSASEETRLVGLGIASFDLDGPAENVRMAQLATDAGVTVGLSGGSPAAGIPFGPPATFFRLRMRCTGGAATVTLVATRRSGGTESFSFSLASGDDVSESIFSSDYSALVWYSAGAGAVTVEVI
jgi:hypothetical protein